MVLCSCQSAGGQPAIYWKLFLILLNWSPYFEWVSLFAVRSSDSEQIVRQLLIEIRPLHGDGAPSGRATSSGTYWFNSIESFNLKLSIWKGAVLPARLIRSESEVRISFVKRAASWSNWRTIQQLLARLTWSRSSTKCKKTSKNFQKFSENFYLSKKQLNPSAFCQIKEFLRGSFNIIN